MIKIFQAWWVRKIVQRPYTKARFDALQRYGITRVQSYTLKHAWHPSWVTSLLTQSSVADRDWLTALSSVFYTDSERWNWTIYSISTLHNPVLAKSFFDGVSIKNITPEVMVLFEQMDDPWLFWVLSKLTDWHTLASYPVLEFFVTDRLLKSHPIWFLGEYYAWAYSLLKQMELSIPYWWWNILTPSPDSKCPRPDSFLCLRYQFAGGEVQQLIERKRYGTESLTRQRNKLLACHPDALMFASFYGNVDIFQRAWLVSKDQQKANAFYVLQHYYIESALVDRIKMLDNTCTPEPLILGYCLEASPMEGLNRYISDSGHEPIAFSNIASDIFSST